MSILKKDLNKISDLIWEIPKSFRTQMRVPAQIFASDKILEDIMQDRSLEQLVNSATLPGVWKKVLAMPDIHEGYGLPVGGVMATRLPKGIISPGSIGYDINCGVRLLASSVFFDEIQEQLKKLADGLFGRVPSGLGRGGELRITGDSLEHLLAKGAEWMVQRGYGERQDLEFLEEKGRMFGADPAKISERAKKRGEDQIGTLGSGNHFLEVQKVAEIFDEKVAEIFGITKNQIVVLIHSGSRGLGHQVCTDYVNISLQAGTKYGIFLPDRELAAVPFDSHEGQDYMAAQACALNYAWANRQYLAHLARQVFDEVLAGKIKNRKLKVVYDVAHNIGKVEEYEGKKLLIHRKGATRAFGPGRPEIPRQYQKVGQPVIIPGSMGTASYVLVGTKYAMENTFGTTCHGAGRSMSRGQAKRTVRGSTLREELEKKGILIRCASNAGLAEEAPVAYKNIDDVVQVVDKLGIANKVAKMEPLIVIKGG